MKKIAVPSTSRVCSPSSAFITALLSCSGYNKPKPPRCHCAGLYALPSAPQFWDMMSFSESSLNMAEIEPSHYMAMDTVYMSCTLWDRPERAIVCELLAA